MLPSLVTKLWQHIYISLSATLIAIAIGVPIGIFITYQKKLRTLVLNIINVLQTIPSLALLAFLIPFLGIGLKPTLVTLVAYALLPITQSAFTGIREVDKDIVEAATGLGFTWWQCLRLVQLPMAIPVILSGIRVATAMTIGITTIAAFIGAGGLGDFITQGLALNDNHLILLGAIPTAALALAVDFLLANFQNSITHPKLDSNRPSLWKLMTCIILIATLIAIIISQCCFIHTSRKNTIIIASKNFTEQYILADIMADLIRAKTGLTVEKRLNLGTTGIIQNAFANNEIDIYPGYTGTAYLLVLKHKKILNAKQTYRIVKKEYRQKFKLIWLPPFGFSNTQTLAVTKATAKKYYLKTLSDLALVSDHFTLGAPAEFIKRPDALPGLTRAYGLRFKNIIQLEPDLTYKAIESNEVNIIEVFSTDGRVKEYKLVPLKDNKHFYPPYQAAPVIRAAVLKAHPEIKAALKPLAHGISQKDILRLNYLVEVKKESPTKVAEDYIAKKGWLKSTDRNRE